MPVEILIASYSRSGHTARLADTLAHELEARGAVVAREYIRPLYHWNKWALAIPLLPLLPLLPLYLLSPRFRKLWHRIYFQPRQAILPLHYPSLKDFDHVLIGTPKWLYMAYPVAEWIDRVEDIDGADISAFGTYCGPPLPVFENDMLFRPLAARLARRGALPGATLGLSSDHHPYFFRGEMRALFRWLSRRRFHRPLADFTLDGEVGQAEVQRFCNEVMAIIGQRPGVSRPPADFTMDAEPGLIDTRRP